MLNLVDYMNFRKIHETPTTPAIPLLRDLLRCAFAFDRDLFLRKIDERRESILDIVGTEQILGEGPVITFKEDVKWKSLAEDFGLYKSGPNYQIFLWSGEEKEYERLYKILKGLSK
jgi:hypothetical protein